MRKVRIQAIWLLFISCFPPLQAQWDAPVTRYWTVKGHYNPAFTGGDETIELSALYRFQWAGIQHAPQRVIFSAHQSFHFLNRQHGAGVTGYRNTAGSLRNDLLAAQYSYILPTHSGNIHFGLQAGMLNLAFNEGGAHIGGGIAEGSQPSFNAEGVQGQLADLNAGIAWQGDNGYAGLSFLHLNEPGFRILNDTLDQQSDSLQLFIPCTIHLMVGYNIRLSRSLAIEPMVWLQTGKGTTRLQATLRTVTERFSGGLSWRSADGYSLFAATIIEGFEIGYGYDHHTRGMGKRSRGSHELTLRYLLPAGQPQQKRLPQKSIRLL
ncbi:MAG: PorP/SprF family type IX secretion system membrane protein [Proteiniphilum sp.]